MPLINAPNTTPVDRLEVDKRGRVSLVAVADGWRNFFNAVFAICNGVTQSGPSAQRPTEDVWLGRVYWDSTLQIPIYYAGGGVWKSAAGVPV